MRVALQLADTKIQAWFAKSVVVILWSLILFVSALLPQLHFQIRAFRPGL